MMLKEFVLFIVLVAVPTVRATAGDLGEECIAGTPKTCNTNMACNTAGTECECDSTHYNNGGTCTAKILNGETCTNVQTCEDGNQCKAQGDKTLKCTEDGKLYGACTGTQGGSNRCGTPSTDHMECNTDTVCECAAGYYATGNENNCPNEKIAAGTECNANADGTDDKPCVEGTTCQKAADGANKICTENGKLYGACLTSGDNKCGDPDMNHMECGTGDVCECATDYYAGATDNTCPLSKIATGAECNADADAEGTDDTPCVEGTTCQKAADGKNKICKLNKDGQCNANFEGDNLPCVDGTECKDKKEGDSTQGRVCKDGAGFLQASMLMVVVTVMASFFARG